MKNYLSWSRDFHILKMPGLKWPPRTSGGREHTWAYKKLCVCVVMMELEKYSCPSISEQKRSWLSPRCQPLSYMILSYINTLWLVSFNTCFFPFELKRIFSYFWFYNSWHFWNLSLFKKYWIFQMLEDWKDY